MTAAIEVRAYDSTGTGAFVVLERRSNVNWKDALGGIGNVSVPVDDPVLAANPALLDRRNIVKFHYAGAERYAFRIERRRTQVVSTDEKRGRTVTVSGREVTCLLDDLVNYPEYGLSRTSADERIFGFMSLIDDWYVSAEWVAPVGVLWTADSTARAGNPTDWPDPAAQIIWPTSPTAPLPGGEVAFFRTTLVAGAPTQLKIFATADNTFELYLDGEPFLQSDPSDLFGWRTTQSKTVDLAAGGHVLAARVENVALLDGAANPAGFMCTVATLDADGNPATFVRRTDTVNWLCHDDTPVPGWRAAQVLIKLHAEALARGVAAAQALTLGFTSVEDSATQTWVDRQDVAVQVAFETALDVATKLIESSIDIAVGPDMVLRAWKRRGTDRTVGPSPVTLTTGQLVDHAVTASAPTATTVLARSGQGWVEVTHADATAEHGRIEGGLQLGAAQSLDAAESIVDAAFATTATPPAVVESGQMPALPGTTPYLDFDRGDDVLTLGEDGTLIAARVMAFSVVEDAEGQVFFTPELYA